MNVVHVVVMHDTGALAASAPIVQFYGTGFDPYAFYDIATNTYTNASAQCSQLIKQAFATVQSLGSTPSGRSQLQTIFRPCSPLNSQRDVLSLLAWLISGLTNMVLLEHAIPEQVRGCADSVMHSV